MFPHLLAPGRIGSLELRNRIVMTPMGEDLGNDDGTISERQVAYAEARAKGGVAMVMLGSVAVGWPRGASNTCQTGISDDRFLPGLSSLSSAVHAHGAKVALQLTHAGKVGLNDIAAGRPMFVPSMPAPPGRGGDPLWAQVTAAEAAAQSAPMMTSTAKVEYRVMDDDDIALVVSWFADATARAREGGIDGVELHAGHGYLIDEFLSPTTNHRTDRYGGSLENRARFLVECLTAIRQRVGRDYPVWVRINAHEYFVEGTTLTDAMQTARLAEAAGADAIHVSTYADPGSAIGYTEAHTTHRPGSMIPFAADIKRAVGVPVIAVGRIEPEVADNAIAASQFDFVAMGRKLLADADLPNKLAEGRADDVRPCMYHYRCIGQIFIREGVRCAVNPTTGRERELAIEPAATARRVLVVGGGPAGMETARLASLRGHEVVLCERSDVLGGRLRYAAKTYAPNADVLTWLRGQIAKQAIDVRLSTEVDAAFVESLQPDAVVVATGAVWARPPVPIADGTPVRTVDDASRWLLEGEALPDGPVVVLGGGRAGLGLAQLAGDRGHAVTVLEEGRVFATQLGLPGRWRLIHELTEQGITMIGDVKVNSIDQRGVTYSVAGAGQVAIEASTVLVASVIEADTTFADQLRSRGVTVHTVGDCTGAGYIEKAMLDAATLAVALV